MFKKILSVGGWTLLSRLTGFIRDVIMAAMMGAGPITDAFVVALRLPNHFRAIFGEGAFNAAFIPGYSRLLETHGQARAHVFSSQIWSLMIMVQVTVLVMALLATSSIVALFAPGFSSDPVRFDLAVTLTRISFPYLLFVTLVTLLSGVLNAHDRFATAAAAPVLLNVSLIVALLIGFLFPTNGHAAAWGVAIAGVLELILVWWDAKRQGIAPKFAIPRFDQDVTSFFKTLGPAVIGSSGIQIALFTDTILASYLPTGAVSSLYYAERLYQLPIGVIGIAAGTVLLPQMSRALAQGALGVAYQSQARVMIFTLALALPFVIVFLTIPDLVMNALFGRGAFDETAASRSGQVLSAYAIGLPAIVLMRSVITSFYARSDTKTPLYASLVAVFINVALKALLTLPIFLSEPLGAVGLALATSAGAWINIIILIALAQKNKWMAAFSSFTKPCLVLVLASLLFVAGLMLCQNLMLGWPKEVRVVLVCLPGMIAYGMCWIVLPKVLRFKV